MTLIIIRRYMCGSIFYRLKNVVGDHWWAESMWSQTFLHFPAGQLSRSYVTSRLPHKTAPMYSIKSGGRYNWIDRVAKCSKIVIAAF